MIQNCSIGSLRLSQTVLRITRALLGQPRKVRDFSRIPMRLCRLRLRYWTKRGRGFIRLLYRSVHTRCKTIKFPETLQIRVINLEKRKDRRAHIRSHFSDLGFEYLFSPGVENDNGELGCALAHVLVLKNWNRGLGELLVVCEDDLLFTKDRAELESLIMEFRKNEGIDVLCLGHNSVGPFVRISGTLALSADSQTTSCYVLKPSSLPLVLGSFERSLEELRNGGAGNKWAIDILWKKLQRESMVFAVPRVPVAHQIRSFSDVQKNIVEYGV